MLRKWYNDSMDKKRALGQFFTKDEIWLKSQVVDFIVSAGCTVAYDPFAGAGDLLRAAEEKLGFTKVVGLDIDENLNWQINDSLLSIPRVDNAIIITNPPYISNYSAARKGLDSDLKRYFERSSYSDVYMIALDKMLQAQEKVVAIIPETFINSKYKQKDLLASITILEENPFDDTEAPVIVACFDGKKKTLFDVRVYKNDDYVGTLGNIERLRLRPSGLLDMTFNDPNGWLAVRCVDTTNPADMIRFDRKENIKYDWTHRIKVSSRLLTLIQIDVADDDRDEFIRVCNELLYDIRERTSDIILSPFKGNMKDGRRRRRLDFMTCRALVEMAYAKLYGDKNVSADIVEDSSEIEKGRVYAQ